MNGKPNSQMIEIFRDFEKIPFHEILAIIAASWLLIRFFQWFLPFLAERVPGSMRLRLLPLVPVMRLAILVFAIVLITPMVISMTPQNLVAVLGTTGLALGFAFKDYVSSLIAGIVATYEHPYRLGDWVEVENVYGEVRNVGMRAIQLVTPDDTLVTIPHMKIWTTGIHNANDGKRNLLCVAEFYLHPDHDGAAVRNRLQDVALTSPYIDLERRSTVIVSEVPWGTRYRLKAYPLDSRDQFQFITDMTIRGKEALLGMGVKFASALYSPEAGRSGQQ